jgi:hypothetical protein
MKQVYSSFNAAEVGLAQSRLEAAGIESETRNDFVSNVMLGAPFCAELWVLKDEDYDEARDLLESQAEPTELRSSQQAQP